MNHWYTIKALGVRGAAEISIYEEIGGFGITAKQFAEDLKALGDVSHIDLRIHSPGGDVFEGIAIYNLLRNHPAEITVYIDGVAASMASVVAMAGDRVVMPERLKNIQPAGGHDKLKLYRVTDILTCFLDLPVPASLEEMEPHDRKAWYQSERERLKFEQETAQLIPADDVRKEMAIWGEIVSEELAKLPNILARDAGLKPMAVNRVQSIIDDLCNQIISRMVKNDVVNEVAKQA
ncbi:head maturation protease, ClpP-related [Escherichia coli O9,30:H25]